MSVGIRIVELSIPEVLDNLKHTKWRVPKFQREFVWDTSAVSALATSVIDGYPIGMVTLWEQPSDSNLGLEPLSIDDWDTSKKQKIAISYGKTESAPAQVMAILDGRQRSTALAMAFGGFAPSFGKNRYAGKYFLNASLKDPLERVVFKKKSEIEKEGLINLQSCIAKGYFPLASFDSDQTILQQWYQYIQLLKTPSIYPDGMYPDEDEIARRDSILQTAFEGITATRLGACIVPQKYELGQICEIFETLNLTGMKVTPVDLINSWLLRDTEDRVHLREWLDDLSETEGAVGWSVPKRRPELIAQFVTASYVAMTDLESKPEPRRVSGSGKSKRLSSIKASDLLATPTEHWLHVISNTQQFSKFIGDFQKCVANGNFSYLDCPYPASAAIYVSLRWHKAFDAEHTHGGWAVSDLDRLFKAFFWRNSLSQRYDQGFLSQIGTDIASLRDILAKKYTFETTSAWLEFANKELNNLMKGSIVPDKEKLIDYLTDGRAGGALQSALLLPIVAPATVDFRGTAFSGDDASRAELHHIYPIKWCRNNASGSIRNYLLRNDEEKNYVDSISNLMPLSRKTNSDWKDKSPSTYFTDLGIRYEDVSDALSVAFIDQRGFNLLIGGLEGIPHFWERRAALIADQLIDYTLLK